MTAQIPLVPVTAPFTQAQRAWLNGFFAGLLGWSGQAGFPAEAPTAPTALAGGAPAAPPPPPAEEAFPWHDPALALEERLRLAEGKPLERVLMAAMAQLDCGACGYRCQTYSEALARGEEKRLTLCAPGGRATAAKLKELIATRAQPASKPAAPQLAAAAPAARPSSTYSRQSTFAARLVRSVWLNQRESEKETRLVVLDLEGSGLHFEPGDALGVYPENCPELVGAMVRALKATGNEEVPLPGGGMAPLREALLRHLSIGAPTEELLELIGAPPARFAPAGEELDVIDLLEKLPRVSSTPVEIARALSPLEPRLYSISSSLRAHPDEVHLTVGVVRYVAAGRMRVGVASTFLAERLKPGQRARVFVERSPGFKLPEDDQVPIIMIGPGTGIAPFRAFLEERKARGARGRNWLFFGGQRQAHDFLYRDELEAYHRDGLLTRLDTAFSRDQAEKVYVQHRMLEHAPELWRWMGEGARIYVCGDARRMARDVDSALQCLVASQGQMSDREAKEHLSRLSRDHRYVRDVY